ncbi:carotenoid biosynthesis protein [Neolewinella agarilytica]|uniref:carotenoid biosynthesis protein n=1 Tax=Neolewinella agarilytica TaxID=478744 RepID=UPI002353FA32|nr:carotenoid biosynthesis protein [Neolewinella agarilytica]
MCPTNINQSQGHIEQQQTITGASSFDRYLSYFLIFAFSSGALAHCLPAVLPITQVTTDGLLFVLNGLVLYAIYRANQDKRLFVWLAIAYVFTFIMEALGVATGAIFGEYAYGPTMWFQWLGVPFVIALNWCVLTLACNEVVIRLFSKKAKAEADQSGIKYRISHIAYPLLAGVLTAAYDVLIEPVAIKLDYWQWAAGDIPLQNYLAWAAIAFVISLPLHLLKIRFRSPVLLVYFLAQLFFFVVLNFML